MPLHYDKRGAVAVLTLSRPEARNAWCPEFNAGFQELRKAIARGASGANRCSRAADWNTRNEKPKEDDNERTGGL
jgi:hypothetical protein